MIEEIVVAKPVSENKPKKVTIGMLKKEIDSFMKKENMIYHGQGKFLSKALVIMLGYIGLYLVAVFAPVPLFIKWLVCAGLGLFHALAAMNIVHDAVHNSSFKSGKWNKRFGKFFNLMGTSTNNWRIQHNVIHHKYTNIDGKDFDIENGGLLRLAPEQPKKAMHKFQQYYAWLVYGLLHLNWITFKDFNSFNRYVKMGHIKPKEQGKELRTIIFAKIFYWTYAMVVPMLVMDLAWYQILFGFLTYQFVIGVYLSVVFQMAHTVENVQFPEDLTKDYLLHQVSTTADFNPTSKLVTWFTGGLNNQVLHHLFPAISHVHYPKLNIVLQDFLKKHDLPYHSNKTFISAIGSHFKHLRTLGRVA